MENDNNSPWKRRKDDIPNLIDDLDDKKIYEELKKNGLDCISSDNDNDKITDEAKREIVENNSNDNADSNLPRHKGEGGIERPKFTPGKTFADRTPEERKRIATLGGRAGKGLTKKHYTKCIDCPTSRSCPRAFEERELGKCEEDTQARCVYEIEGRQSVKNGLLKDMAAIVSSNPQELSEKISITLTKLEAQVDMDPSFAKLMQLNYLLMNVYKMKFGNINHNVQHGAKSSNATVDIKDMMKAMREQQTRDKAIDAEVVEKDSGEGGVSK